ncbi:hypothetical protein A374_09513 [Fictibacillus macauensis ZFHKF-1]|uniref:DUF2953 domain-containing protein n=1 Tax=Fictibacillus macauensis ZFHKF-1 TaxID=1196324 RepID=I8AJ15_9BACL|nr:DUF2953 domain-containing protein [Fictibacillus macauensis]EIT85464.1 hypothetical protein A374_09513 [Fictibacillus macauensis ZFHKF-1]
MFIFAIVVGCVVLLLCVLYFSSIHLSFVYAHKKDDDFLRVKLVLWKWLHYTYTLPVVKVKPTEQKIEVKKKTKSNAGTSAKEEDITPRSIKRSLRDFKKFLFHVQGFYKIFRRFLQKVNVSDVEWQSRFGLGDACHTATAVGVLWSVKSNSLGVLSRFVQLKNVKNVMITPVYQGMYTETRISCMVSFKIGHAMTVMFQILKHWRRMRSDEKKKMKNYTSSGGTSHVRASD